MLIDLPLDGSTKVLAHSAWNGGTPKFALRDITLGRADGKPN